MVYNDVSHKGLGCVLMQHENVISYISKKYKPNKIKYPIYDIKLVIVVFALNIWRHYIYIYIYI